MFSLINQLPDIDRVYLHAKDPYGTKYQFLVINEKVQAQSILMILKPSMNTQMIWMIFIKKLKNGTQIKSVKH